MTSHTALQLETIHRITLDDIAYVLYSDGAYRHIVTAEHYDAETGDVDIDDLLGDDETASEAYTHWCDVGHRRGAFPDDATAIRVGRAAGVSMIHSAIDGTCSPLAIEDDAEPDTDDGRDMTPPYEP